MPPDKAALVSVVTPVYNGEKFLRECIESVLDQTYQNVEYMIVNNCSTDGTAAIADEYASRDSRVKVYHNESFLRVNANYNRALLLISPDSKYCKTIAADDWMYPECLEKMVNLAESNPQVAIVGAYALEGLRVVPVNLPYDRTIIPGREICRMWLQRTAGYPFKTPSTILYRSDIVRSRPEFLSESSLAGDEEVCLEVLEDNDFGFVHQILTYLREHEGSVTSFSISMNTYLSANLNVMQMYGPRHLSADEVLGRTHELLHSYYQYLAKQLYNRRDRAFWNYHRSKLQRLGHSLNYPKLLAFAAVEGLSFAIDPKRLLRRVTGQSRHS